MHIVSRPVLTAVLSGLALAASAGRSDAAVITQLTSFAQFVSVSTEGNDFEGASKNTANITFDATTAFGTAASWTGGVTSSGVRGLVEAVRDEPLTASLGVDAFEVGLFFGNDDFGLAFNAILRVYDSSSALLGSVMVAANRNDFADQFIGLRSDTAFRRVEVSYERPAAMQLSDYVDDFTIGKDAAPVAEPGPLLLLGGGLAALSQRRRHRG